MKAIPFEDFQVDFSDDEIDRRMTELMRRCAGHQPTFDMKTGQPFKGEQLSNEELRRRGYL